MTVLLVSTLAVTACSTTTSAPTTFGVDGAPQLIQETYLTALATAKAGPQATPDERQMWTTAATAAATSFCPVG